MKRVVSTVLFCVVVYALSLLALALIAPFTTAVGPGSGAFIGLGGMRSPVTVMVSPEVISAHDFSSALTTAARCRTHACAVPVLPPPSSVPVPVTTSPHLANLAGVGLWLVPLPADLMLAVWFVRRMLRTSRTRRVVPV